MKNKTVCILNGPKAYSENGVVYTNRTMGKIIDEFALQFGKVILCVGEVKKRSSQEDYKLNGNVEFLPIPYFEGAFDGFLKSSEVFAAYKNGIGKSDLIFARGVLTPAIFRIHMLANKLNKPIIQWIVGNPLALLKTHNRHGLFKDFIGKSFVRFWNLKLRIGHIYNKKSWLLCNGTELYKLYDSQRSSKIVSTTLEPNDFIKKQDTCSNDLIHISSICYIRPEKGIEFLISSMPMIKNFSRCKLSLYGSRDQYPQYQKKLDMLITELGLESKVSFGGHLTQTEIDSALLKSDLFVLPTLSEGTPRVLIEAKAKSVPVIGTNVGGVPDSIEHLINGLLVEPKSPVQISEAIDLIIDDKYLRQRVIANGYAQVQELTVKSFVNNILSIFRVLESSQ